MWKVGDKLRHRFDPGAGPGRVTALEGRSVVVHFPASDATVRFAAASDALAPYEMPPGTVARLAPGGELVRIGKREGDAYRLEDGRLAADTELWPEGAADEPVECLVRGEVDPLDAFANRLDALHLKELREAGGLGSYLGGRIRIFPHQLYVAERATRTDPVRWLLADEVGLGKTVEACLVTNRLARTGRAARILIVAPSALTVQWLGELYRKFHQLFVLLDDKRREDVARELGASFNPFEAHARSILALEDLVANPALTRLAVAAGHDLLIVDEAHRLQRASGGHPGNPAYRAVAPLAGATRHVLLLTATPLESDAHGYFRLLQLLRPGELPEDADFEQRLARGLPLPPCTSATRRADIGGLPPRVPTAVLLQDEGSEAGLPDAGAAATSAAATSAKAKGADAKNASARSEGHGREGENDADEKDPDETSVAGTAAAVAAPEILRDAHPRNAAGWASLLALEERVKRLAAGTPPERRRRIDRYRRALASPAAYAPLLAADETIAKAEAAEALGADPRALWLVRQAPRWRKAGEKTLVFVAHIETLEWLKTAIERETGQRVGIFHEALAPARADIEVAQFRLSAGPAILIATECGGEGRNFQFCRRLVLFDLPWNPGLVEQRIGRLDRIDRRRPVEILFFRPPAGLGRDIAALYERIGVLREPLAGLEGTFSGVEAAIEAAAAGEIPEEAARAELTRVAGEARRIRSKIREAAWHELHREPYRPELGPGILARIPEDLEETTREVVVAACEEFGFRVIPQREEDTVAIEFGSAAKIDHLPGVPGGSNFLGTFDRDAAVEKETIDFFASGHPLVEGILQELEEGPRGRVALLQVRSKSVSGRGVLALYAKDGHIDSVILDENGREHPEWEPLLLGRPLRSQRVKAEEWSSQEGWAQWIRELFREIRRNDPPFAVAAFRIVHTSGA